jgi:hypothetical protein
VPGPAGHAVMYADKVVKLISPRTSNLVEEAHMKCKDKCPSEPPRSLQNQNLTEEITKQEVPKESCYLYVTHVTTATWGTIRNKATTKAGDRDP